MKSYIWLFVICIGGLITYLRLGYFKSLFFFIGSGFFFTFVVAMISLITSFIRYKILKGKKIDNSDIIDNIEPQKETNYIKLFHFHMLIVSILMGVFYFFRK